MLISFHPRLIKGIHAHDGAGAVAGKLEEVEQLSEVVCVQTVNGQNLDRQLLAVSFHGGIKGSLVDLPVVLAIQIIKVVYLVIRLDHQSSVLLLNGHKGLIEDGGTILVKISCAEEAMYRWAMLHGGEAEIVEPESLRERVKETVSQMVETFRE